MDRLLDLAETADLLKVSKWSLYRLVAAGLPHIRVGRLLRFRELEVLDWLSGPVPKERPQTVKSSAGKRRTDLFPGTT